MSHLKGLYPSFNTTDLAQHSPYFIGEIHACVQNHFKKKRVSKCSFVGDSMMKTSSISSAAVVCCFVALKQQNVESIFPLTLFECGVCIMKRGLTARFSPSVCVHCKPHHGSGSLAMQPSLKPKVRLSTAVVP